VLDVWKGPAGRTWYDLPESPRPDPETPAPVRFLPEWDSAVVTRADERIVARADRPRVFLPGLRVAALVLVDGFAAGAWKVSATARKATMTIETFSRAGAPEVCRAAGGSVRGEGGGGMSPLMTLLGIAIVIFGVASLVAPILPGVAIVYLGILVVAWADDFTRIGPLMLMVMLAVMLVALVADNVAGLFGARKAGASAWGVFGAGLGALAGLFLGLPGVILGPAVGALVFEYARNPDAKRAMRAGAGGLLGFFFAVVAKAVFAFLLIGLAVIAYVF
jgi:uncharacterized protein